MNGSLNIFGSKRLNRSNADGVNPALAEVTRQEMFGVYITGASALSATSGTTVATGSLSLFVDEDAFIPGGSLVGAPSRPRILGVGKTVAQSGRTYAAGFHQLVFRGSGSATSASGITQGLGFVINRNGFARATAGSGGTRAQGYATRGNSERLALAMLLIRDE